ncbi:MAG: polysaccharide deacetylase family protein [Myxococcales bacterium]|nr:polysaccharide deacetylase family protein [Myxococcales bacterium]
MQPDIMLSAALAKPRPVYPGRCGLALLWLWLAGGLALAAAKATGVLWVVWPLWWWLIGLAAAVTIGVRFAQTGVFARPLLRVSAAKGRLALTFDDGPHPRHTRQILDLLDACGQRATFFVVGDKVAHYPEVAREIVARGHGIANHSLRHQPWTPMLPARMLATELVTANTLIFRHTGVKPTFFRAPVGLISPPVAAAALRAGLQLVHWSGTARDGLAWAQPQACLERLRKATVAGAILVLHDGVGVDDCIAVRILPQLLADMAALGLQSVRLDELVAAPTEQPARAESPFPA